MSTDEEDRIKPISADIHKEEEIPSEWHHLSKAQKQRFLVVIRRILLLKELR